MEKLNLHSPDFTQENIAKLTELFLNCMTETSEADGIVFYSPQQATTTAIISR
jgi:adenine-specific DNA-methyltransferase